MDISQLGTSAINHVIGIMDQIATLNWVLILSGVGFCESIIGRRRRQNKLSPWTWCLPIILGLAFGLFEFVKSAAFTNIFQYLAGSAESAFSYMGWITLVYTIAMRPFKYLGDRIKTWGSKPGTGA